LSRLPDATVRLAELIRKSQRRQFRWGSFDCCQFAARAVHAITGRDPRDVFPVYRTRAQAESILADCTGLEALASKALGERIHPSRASTGDIVLCDFGRGPQPAVCIGAYCLAPGRQGLERRMTLNAVAAWKV
jgi:hypothetical protein